MVKETEGYRFWREVLGSPHHILAPMVEQSELPWRLLSRRYGAQLCYTPMLHASVFIKDARYRKENMQSCEEDRPLIVQFCANDVETFVEAAKLAQDYCEAIDLNLGCPQTIAQRGHYGAFLEDEWDLLKEMISVATSKLKVPITCKIRVFKDVDKTVCYAQMLEAAGCKLLTVHGRTKEQKGPTTGLASWEHIKAVKSNVKIPVFSNGNIQYLPDVVECMKQTGADGVMIAEGSLHNPALFQGINLPVWQMALEYLQLVERYPCSLSCVRGHIFKLCHYCLIIPDNHDIRQRLACAKSIQEFFTVVNDLKLRYENFKQSDLQYDSQCSFKLRFPPWICQPYVRSYPNLNDQKCGMQKRQATPSSEEMTMSKKKLKKLMKHPRKQISEKKIYEKCAVCSNPKGTKCAFNLCRLCCKMKTTQEVLDCHGHRLLVLRKFHTNQNVVEPNEL